MGERGLCCVKLLCFYSNNGLSHYYNFAYTRVLPLQVWYAAIDVDE